jgi:DNA modification methylase
MVRLSHESRAPTNRLIQGDCLDVARALDPASIDLVYVDPPFFSGREQRGRAGTAFADRWDGGLEDYLVWLRPRLEAVRGLLKETGSLYVHLDWHAVHYVKVELDRIFGYRNFLNEVVWLYGLGGSSSRYWPRKHDNILWYARRRGRHWFEAARVPATSQRMKGRTKKAPDYWHIPALNNMARERLGYPTQKPEALLRRIVESSCPPGGTVADFFCGAGTTLAVAAKCGRRWVGCDVSEEAIAVTRKRLEGIGAGFEVVGV